MYEQTNTMMETKTTFQIPQLLDGDDFTSEDLADDMEGLRLSFTRIKIPGGGHLQFEIPSGNRMCRTMRPIWRVSFSTATTPTPTGRRQRVR